MYYAATSKLYLKSIEACVEILTVIFIADTKIKVARALCPCVFNTVLKKGIESVRFGARGTRSNILGMHHLGCKENYHACNDLPIEQHYGEADVAWEERLQMENFMQRVNRVHTVPSVKIFFQNRPQLRSKLRASFDLNPLFLRFFQSSLPPLAWIQLVPKVNGAGKIATITNRSLSKKGIQIIHGGDPVVDVGNCLVPEGFESLGAIVVSYCIECLKHLFSPQATSMQEASIGNPGMASHLFLIRRLHSRRKDTYQAVFLVF